LKTDGRHYNSLYNVRAV